MLQDIHVCKDGVEYVLVFKLSRFGQNAADVLNSLQLMQDFGVNLICVEDGIDSSKDSGKLMISVLSAWQRLSVRIFGSRRWPNGSKTPVRENGVLNHDWVETMFFSVNFFIRLSRETLINSSIS